MGSNYSLEAIVKVIAVGVPALLIVLGFFAFMGGFTMEMLTGNVGMKNFGISLIAAGIIIYLIELAVVIYSEFS